MAKRTFFHLNIFVTCLLAAWSFPEQVALSQGSAPTAIISTSSTLDASSASTIRFLAVDREGNPVTDLQAQDLSVLINKLPSKIVSLSPAASAPFGIGLFFDISGSRREDQLIAREVQATSKFLEAIWRPGDLGFAVAFGEIPVTLAEPTSDLQQIESALQKIPDATYRGSTAVYDALCSVHLSPRQIALGENLFIVVSDFQDNSSHISADKMIQMLRGEKIQIFPLLRIEEDERRVSSRHLGEIARRVAEKTGGDVLTVSSEKDLESVFHRLHGELQGAYVLTYEPLPQEGKAEEQQVRTSRRNVRILFPRY